MRAFDIVAVVTLVEIGVYVVVVIFFALEVVLVVTGVDVRDFVVVIVIMEPFVQSIILNCGNFCHHCWQVRL